VATAVDEERAQKFVAWLDEQAQHGLTHNPKMVDSQSKAQVPRCVPSDLPVIPELHSGDLADPEPFGLDITSGAQQGGIYSLLHNPKPMALGSPYRAFVAKGVFPPLKATGGSLYDRFKRKDPELLACVPPELGSPEAVAEAVVSAQEMSAEPVACQYLKQVYFPVDGNFHLLGIAPSSLLALQLHHLMQTWVVRDAEGNFKEMQVVAPDTVRVNYGGSKPQNVGRLAVEYKSTALLSSCPPKRQPSLFPFGQQSFWVKWAQVKQVKRACGLLNTFLASNPTPNQATRTHRDSLADRIIELLLDYREGLRASPGWTTNPNCILTAHQKCWLDPQAEADMPEVEVHHSILTEFAQVLGQHLPDVPHGQLERQHWQHLLGQAIKGLQ